MSLEERTGFVWRNGVALSLSLSYSLADYWLAVAGSGYSNNPIYQDKPSSVEEGAWKASALRNRFNLNCSCKKKTAVW